MDHQSGSTADTVRHRRITTATRSAPRPASGLRCSVLALFANGSFHSPFCFARMRAYSGRFSSARTAPCSGQICAPRKLRIATFVRRNGCRQEKIHLRADLLLLHLNAKVPPRMLLAWLLSNLMPGNSCPPARRICANRSIMFFNWIALLN